MTKLRDRIALVIRDSYRTNASWPFIAVDEDLSEWIADAVMDVLLDPDSQSPPLGESSD